MGHNCKTAKEYEEYLNDTLTSSYSIDDILENLAYFPCKKSTIRNAYHNGKLGTLLRKHDPIGFYTGLRNDF